MAIHPFEVLKSTRLLPMFGPVAGANYAKLASLLAASGLPVAEVLFRAPGAAEAVRRCKAAMPSVAIGAGTILTTDQLDEAVDAGADFIVSPGLNPDTIKYAQDKGVPILPGICTPSDIERGLALGLTHFKFFPAESYGGLKTLKSLADPYNMVSFLPTGGISPDNLQSYLAHPSIFACGGSWMVAKDILAVGDYAEIENRLRAAKQLSSFQRKGAAA